MIFNLVYALESPFDGKVYYIGQSKKGLVRPYSHCKSSHNKELFEWIQSLGREPIVRILENNIDDFDLLNKESYWINEMKKRGEPLFNKIISTERTFKCINYNVSIFIKEKRKEYKISQIELSKKVNVGLRLIREIEQGKESCRVDKLLEILNFFGATLIPVMK